MIARPALAAIAIAALVGGLAACGDDDDPSGDSATTDPAASSDTTPSSDAPSTDDGETTVEGGTPDTTTGDGAETSVDPEAAGFCAAVAEIRDFAASAEEPTSDAPFDEQKQAVIDLIEGMTPLYQQASDEAPEEIKDDVDVVIEYFELLPDAIADASTEEEATAALGDAGEDVNEAQTTLDEFARDTCGVGVLAGG